ncbi:MAG: MFS transporter, partial [Actinomycetota bacterium]
ALQLMCVVTGVSYGFVLLSAGLAGLAAALGFIVALGVLGLAETILSPTIPAMVNDLAPNELRGRYNALHALAWSFGSVAGPAMAGLFLGAQMGEEFFALLIAASGVGVLFSRRLKRHVPEQANLIAESDVPEPEPVGA